MLKQINTVVAGIIAVKVPEGATNYSVFGGIIKFSNGIGVFCGQSELPPKFEFEVLGLSPEIGEEVCRNLVHRQSTFGNDYYTCNGKSFETAKEAFASLMQANGCYSVNPYGEKPSALIYNLDEWLEGGSEVYSDRSAQWQQAEANTGTWLILLKL